MINRIRDWKKPIVQLLLPLLVIPTILLLNAPMRIIDVLNKSDVEVSQLDWYWQVAIGLGKWPLIVITLYFIYRYIRKTNKEEVLQQSIEVIVWHSYAGYWVCRYILNYQTISLIRVPIPVQFKLVWRGIFKKYEYMDNITEKEKGTDKIDRTFFNDEPITDTVNLVLADTYPLEWKEKLPESVLNYTTIVIDRLSEKGVRYYSRDFVDMITRTVHEMPRSVKEINFFATINAAHVYHIVNETFKTGGRDGMRRIRIYQQTSGLWVFEGKNIEIKTGVK